jgi:hypothetical protein
MPCLAFIRPTRLLWPRVAALFLLALAATPSGAGQFALVQGQRTVLPLLADVRSAMSACNLHIVVQGQPGFERTLTAPLFMTELQILAQGAAPVQVAWEGRFRRLDNGDALDPCPTAGQSWHPVIGSLAPLRQAWQEYFEQVGPAQADCMRLGLPLVGLRTEGFDRKDPQTSVADLRLRQLEGQCERFVALPKAWGLQDERRHACTLAGGFRTFCEGMYLQPGRNGQSTPLSKSQALALHLQGASFQTAVRESTAVRTARETRQRQELERQKAQEAERIQAEALERQQQEQAAQARKLAEQQARLAKKEEERLKAEEDRKRAEQERLAQRNWLVRTWEDEVMGRIRPAPAQPASPASQAQPKDTAK